MSSPASISPMSSSLTGSETVTFGRLSPCLRGHAAADLDLRDHLAVVDLVHAQPDGAIREVEHVALVAQLRRSPARPPAAFLRGALHLLPREHDPRVARASSATPPATGPIRSFGPGEVTEDRHIALRALRGGAHRLRDFPVLLRVAVREIEPGHIHPGSDHLLENVEILRGWTDGRDDLRGAHRLQHTHPRPFTKSPLLAAASPTSMLTLGAGEALMAPASGS